MNLKNGKHIDRRTKDSTGEQAFVFWTADSFDPCVTLVRGESLEDAYAWYTCDPWVEQRLAITDSFEDYIDGWDSQWVQGIGVTNPATLEQLGEAYGDGRTRGIEYNDNGVLLATEAIDGRPLEVYAR